MAALAKIVRFLDTLLDTPGTPDYPQAVNGLQFANHGEVGKVAAAVDFSSEAVRRAASADAQLLIVHHGMLWGGTEPVTGPAYERTRALIENDIAVYSSHLPLDRHPEIGNNALLAAELGLAPSDGFARFQTISVGVRGESDVATHSLIERADQFARRHGGAARAGTITKDRRTRRWGICTGAGASAETLAEARQHQLDTLIVGEGPHWTAVRAADDDILIIYAGHYATETLGVAAVASRLAERFGVGTVFLDLPTGL